MASLGRNRRFTLFRRNKAKMTPDEFSEWCVGNLEAAEVAEFREMTIPTADHSIDPEEFAEFCAKARAAILELRREKGGSTILMPKESDLLVLFRQHALSRERQEKRDMMRAANNGLLLSKGFKIARKEPVKARRLLSPAVVLDLIGLKRRGRKDLPPMGRRVPSIDSGPDFPTDD